MLVQAHDSERLLALALSRPSDARAEADRLLDGNPGPLDASIAHQARGIVLRDSGRTREAIAELRTALRYARVSGAPERIIDVQATLGVALFFAGRTVAGLAVLDEAVAGSTGVLAGRVLMRRGGLLNLLGRYAEALADLKRAIALLRRGGDTLWEARARMHRFLVYSALGQSARADRDLSVAERLFAAVGQELESAQAVHNRAFVALQTGDLPTALRFLDEAESRYESLSALVPELAVDRCAVLLAAGLASEALAQADAAIRRIDQAGGLATRKAELLFSAARAAQAAGETEIAVSRSTAARDLFRTQRRPLWQARASFVLVQSRYGAGERTGRLAAQASQLADRLDELGALETATAHLLAGRLAAECGQRARADRHLSRAAWFRYHGPTYGRAVGWLAHALRAAARGDTRATLIACGRGLDAAEEHQRTLGALELRAYATAYGTELAAIAQRHSVRRRDARMLLEWTERWRASVLTVPPARPPDDTELAAELAALRDVVRRLDAARSAGVPSGRLEQERRRLEDAIRARTRRTSGAGSGTGPKRAFDFDRLRDRLGDHRLVELVALDDTLYAVTVTRRRTRMHPVGPVAAAERELTLARFLLRRLAYGRPPARALETLDEAGRRLEHALLGDSVSDLDGSPVVLVPPGRLHAVPWALLPSLRRTSVRVAPSAAVWLRAGELEASHAKSRANRTAFIVGPGLPGTATEVAKIAQSYPDASVLADGAATAERVLAELDGALLAHVAAHGVFRADNPFLSSLRLDDGPLTVYDLARLRTAPLRLVLSSCESGLASHVGADELLGIVTALVPLGTTSLLASVVPVNDAASVSFMTAFHERLHDGSSFADALLAARTQVTSDPVAVATAYAYIALGG